jgi:hypothetical protein
VILENCPIGVERADAVRVLRDSLILANASISLDEHDNEGDHVSMMTLPEICIGKLTDKHDVHPNGKSYAEIYGKVFEPLREKPVVLVELGVSGGGSLKAWSEFFTNHDRILGVDIDPNCAQHAIPEKRVEVLTASQDSPAVQNRIQELGGADIIIDDAAHLTTLITRSFDLLWPLVKPGGWYIVEDLGLTYEEDIAAHVKAGGWGGMQHNTVPLINDRSTIDRLLLDVMRRLDSNVEVSEMHLYQWHALIRKAG